MLNMSVSQMLNQLPSVKDPPNKYLNLFDIGVFFILVGLLFSRFAISVGMLCLLFNAIKSYPLRKSMNGFLQDRFLVLLTSVFFVYFMTGLYSEDKAYFFERIRVALPLLVLPFSFAKRKTLGVGYLNKWLLFFFLLILGTAIHSTVSLYIRHSTFNIVFDGDTHLVTPVNHVRYSLMVAFSIFVGRHLLLTEWGKPPFQKYFLGMSALFLILYLHFISVRSGLLGFYLVCLFHILKRFSLTKVKRVLLLCSLLAGLAVSAYHVMPSFRHELDITKENILAYAKGEPIIGLSDNWRVRSIEAGLEVGRKEPLWGVGLGDLRKSMEAEMKGMENRYGIPKRLLPHNQFVFVFAFSGILGLMWFVFVLLNIVRVGYKNSPLFCRLNIIVLSSFLFDTTMETQIGLGFWLFFLLFLKGKDRAG